jgi:Domain of unknown function (DUF4062)
VFISSTLEELGEERAAARRAIRRLHLVPVWYESGARPHPPRRMYRAYLDQSQVFVGIYWQRYGWVAPGMEISGLEDEYRLAAGKPMLLYLKRPAPTFRVFRDQGVPWSQAGITYALLWILVIGARIGFAYATSHSRSVQVWLGTHHITSDAVTDALIFMAVGMLLTRTATRACGPRRCPPMFRPLPPPGTPPSPHLPTADPRTPTEKSHHGPPHCRLARYPDRDRRRRHGHLAQERDGAARPSPAGPCRQAGQRAGNNASRRPGHNRAAHDPAMTKPPPDRHPRPGQGS